MKTPLKVLAVFAIICALVFGGGWWFLTHKAGEIAGSTVSSVTGSDKLGELASKVMSGEDLTDEEIQQSLGIDEKAYRKLKKAASEAGITLTDSDQLKKIALENAGKASEIEDIVSKLKSGEISESQAAEELKDLIGK